jgi:hypothetical protein
MENQQDKPSSFGTWKATVVVLTLIVASLGYSLFDAKQKGIINDATINAKVRELASNQNKLDSISTQLDLKIKEVLELGGKVNDLIALKFLPVLFSQKSESMKVF